MSKLTLTGAGHGFTGPLRRDDEDNIILSYDLFESTASDNRLSNISSTTAATFGPTLTPTNDPATGTCMNINGGNHTANALGLIDTDSDAYLANTDSGVGDLVNGLTEFTISNWVKIDDYSGNKVLMPWFGLTEAHSIGIYTGAAGAYYNQYGYYGDNAEWKFYEYNDLVANVMPMDTCRVAGPPTNNSTNMAHWVMVYDGNAGTHAEQCRLYVNGVDVYPNSSGSSGVFSFYGSGPSSAAISGVTDALYVGRTYEGNGLLNGQLDLVRMWDFAMTQSEIDYEFNSGDGRGGAPD